MRTWIRRAVMGFCAVATGLAAALPSGAASLQFYLSAPGENSFWDPLNWIPALTPGPGDSVRFGARIVPGITYLGDVPGVAGQTQQIARAHFDGTGTPLHWGSSSGGQSGGLTFSQDDPNDPGIGIRIARSNNGAQTVEFYEAQNAPAEAFNLAIGTTDPFVQNQTNFLSLYSTAATPSTLHVNGLLLQGNTSRVNIFPGTEMVAAFIRSNASTDSGIMVGGAGAVLRAADVSFSRIQGGGQVPLLVSTGGFADIGRLGFFNSGLGNDAMVRVESGGTASVGDLAFSSSESRAAIEVDGAGSTLIANLLNAETDGGTVELIVRNGGALSVIDATLANDVPSSTGVPGVVRVLVDGAGSKLSGQLTATGGNGDVQFTNGGECINCAVNVFGPGGLLRFAGASTFGGDFYLVDANAEFVNGAVVNGSSLRLGSGASATIAGTASARFAGIQVDASLSGPVASRVTISGSASTEVVAGSVNLGSDYFLFANGSTLGGDRPGAAASALELLNGAQLRIGDDPLRAELPTLAIGTNGVVSVDPTSAMFIGDALTPASYQAGTLVLDDGGTIRGNGLINGTGFATTHPIVLNTGGDMAPGFSPGTLTIDGGYIQQSGTLTLEIAGVNAGEYDVLDALRGATFLGGTIRFENLGNFTGVLGAQLDFFAGRAVSFDPSLVIEDNTGFGLAFDFATGVATITQLAVPEPPIAALLMAGVMGLGWIGRRRRG